MTKYQVFEDILSKDRLSTYLRLAEGNHDKAVLLYLKNIKVSKEMYAVISQFEVIFRNCINEKLKMMYGTEWYDNPGILLIDKHISALNHVKESLKKDEKEVNNPNITANLHLSFWVYLFNGNYDRTLWRTCFYKIFLHKKALNRSKVRLELEKIKRLRNRIAHCECILNHPYDQYYTDILEFLSWIDPKLSNWIEEISEL